MNPHFSSNSMNNRLFDGSVNGQSFRVGGIVEGVTGPGGRDGYIHLDDVRTHRTAGEIFLLESGEMRTPVRGVRF